MDLTAESHVGDSEPVSQCEQAEFPAGTVYRDRKLCFPSAVISVTQRKYI